MRFILGGLAILLVNIVDLIVVIYIIVLVIKTLRRGIKSLDIYISKNNYRDIPKSDDFFKGLLNKIF